MGDTWHDENYVSSHKEERKNKDLLGLWYKERIVRVGEGTGGEKQREEIKERDKEKEKKGREGEERKEDLKASSFNSVSTVRVCRAKN